MATITEIALQELVTSDDGGTDNRSLRSGINAARQTSTPRAVDLSEDLPQPTSNLGAVFLVFQLCMVNFLGSFTSGTITIGLPTIASSLAIPDSLYAWPFSVYGLSSGSTLLLAGSVADIVGVNYVELAGMLVLGIFILACGRAENAVQLIAFRAMQGIGLSMHLPASIALVTAAIPRGKSRNISFGCLGLSQPLGFSAGLVGSGIMIERLGWRMSFYISGAASLFIAVASIWSLSNPKSQRVLPRERTGTSMLKRLAVDVDWVGSCLVSAGLALLSYVLGVLGADHTKISRPSSVILLTCSFLLLFAFPFWLRFRERQGRAPLIPTTLWKKTSFTTVCVMINLSYGANYAIEIFSSMYFQNVQNVSILFTSLRLLPSLLVGVLLNLIVGFIVHKFSVWSLVAVSSILCAGAPLLMALTDPQKSYWEMEFLAQALSPLSVDVLYTVGLLLISEEFSEETQALAGAVFSTVALFGSSLGISVCQVAASIVSGKSKSADGKIQSLGLLKGYQASFWTMFGLLITCTVLAVGGLRKSGKVGLKRD